MLDDVTLCTGPELNTTGPCGGNASELVEGDQVQILIVDAAGCEFTTSFMWVISNVEESTADVRMYPNPTSGIIQVHGVSPAPEVEVFNALGQCVFQRPLTSQQAQHTLDLSGLPNGTYVLKVGTHRTRILIQR